MTRWNRLPRLRQPVLRNRGKSTVYKDKGYVVDVGAGGAGDDETAGFLKGVVGVVFLQNVENAEASRFQFPVGLSVGIAPGRVRGAVGSVTAYAEDAHIGKAVHGRGGSQCQLLIPAALAVADELHHRLAADQER